MIHWLTHFSAGPIWNFGWFGDVSMHWLLEEASDLVVLGAVFFMPCKHWRHRLMRVGFVVGADLVLALALKVLIG